MLLLNLIMMVAASPLWALPLSCDDLEKGKVPSFYKAIEECEKNRIQSLNKTLASLPLTSLQGNAPCSCGEVTDLPKMCEDPVGFLCSRGNGRVFNAKCEFVTGDPKEAAQIPSYAKLRCEHQKKVKEFIDSKRVRECPWGQSKSDCELILYLKYAREIRLSIGEMVYTPERVERLKSHFTQIKKTYLEAITASKIYTPKIKADLKDRIQKVNLNVPPDPYKECMSSEGSTPETSLFFDISDDTVNLCLGTMANLDYINDKVLDIMLAHELSHSIDPCVLQSTTGKETAAKEVYGTLMACLDGKDAILMKNTAAGKKAFCDEWVRKQQPGEKEAQMLGCQRFVSYATRCPLADQGASSDDLRFGLDFRVKGEPVDQMQEMFVHFMAGEVVGRLPKSKGNTKEDSINDLIALVTMENSFHGQCLKTNTLDPHPPAFIRVNRGTFASEAFRKSLGCSHPPKNSQNCEGF